MSDEFEPIPFSPLTWEVPASCLTARTTRERMEEQFARATDPDWTTFLGLIQPGDELWEYEHLEVHMGFVTGSGGFAIVRDGKVVGGYPTQAYG
jgi:hypothetical protein